MNNKAQTYSKCTLIVLINTRELNSYSINWPRYSNISRFRPSIWLDARHATSALSNTLIKSQLLPFAFCWLYVTRVTQPVNNSDLSHFFAKLQSDTLPHVVCLVLLMFFFLILHIEWKIWHYYLISTFVCNHKSSKGVENYFHHSLVQIKGGNFRENMRPPWLGNTMHTELCPWK